MHIIIPMSGIGKRFIDAGYTAPKPLIQVDNINMPMIQHVVNLFNYQASSDKLTFICNDQHLSNTDMWNTLLSLYPDCNIRSVSVHNRQGPVDAVCQHLDLIEDTDEVIVSYCDYGTWWDYDNFLHTVRSSGADGAIAAYIGFHPHMLGKDNYAFIKHHNMWLEEIREKQPFTSDRMNEYASNGTYYFKTGFLVKKYFTELINRKIMVNNEYYVSLVYNLLKQDNHNIMIYQIDNMLQWGTPYDLECYQMWSNYFSCLSRELNNQIMPRSYQTVTILPMAGKGSRFSMRGYSDPKPLLPINDRSMVIEAVRCLPQSNHTIFVGLKEHFDKYPLLTSEIKSNISNSDILLIDNTTDGQATTCYLAIEHYQIPSDQSLLISACDNGVYYDTNKYDDLVSDLSNDIIVWSFSNNPTSKLFPHMYAWLDIDDNNNILAVSNKKPFDNRPNKYCIIGTMFFRKSQYFVDGYNYITQNHIQTNNEYYVDDMLNYLIQKKLKVKVFNVDYYLCWGTPDDYMTFNYWQEFFNKCWWHPYQRNVISPIHIAHRINTVNQLSNVPKFMGIELDIRDYGNKLIISHDPYSTDQTSEDFEEYIKHYDHRFIILNIKSEGIEYRVKELINKYGIKDYFFLDSSFPMIVKLARDTGNLNMAVRFSEFEDIQTVLNMAGLVKWVWVDCFTKLSISYDDYVRLKIAGFNICLVSPELHNLDRKHEIPAYRQYLIDNNIHVDMVCTKLLNTKLW